MGPNNLLKEYLSSATSVTSVMQTMLAALG